MLKLSDQTRCIDSCHIDLANRRGRTLRPVQLALDVASKLLTSRQHVGPVFHFQAPLYRPLSFLNSTWAKSRRRLIVPTSHIPDYKLGSRARMKRVLSLDISARRPFDPQRGVMLKSAFDFYICSASNWRRS